MRALIFTVISFSLFACTEEQATAVLPPVAEFDTEIQIDKPIDKQSSDWDKAQVTSQQALQELWQAGKASSQDVWQSSKDKSADLWQQGKKNSQETWSEIESGSKEVWSEGKQKLQQVFEKEDLNKGYDEI